MTARGAALALALAAALLAAGAAACPVDAAPRAADVLLTTQDAEGRVVAWTAERLRALGVQTWTERRVVERPGAPAAERSIAYHGVRLRDLLAQPGTDPAADRGARDTIVEAVASDGYRALFSWGELYNAPAGERSVVVLEADGRALDAHQGPLALRALDDLRPGPRHVRNLCALRVRRLP